MNGIIFIVAILLAKISCISPRRIPPAAPPHQQPQVDCVNINQFTIGPDCLQFFTIPSSESNPSTACCKIASTRFKYERCLCMIFRHPNSFGIEINATRLDNLVEFCSANHSIPPLSKKCRGMANAPLTENVDPPKPATHKPFSAPSKREGQNSQKRFVPGIDTELKVIIGLSSGIGVSILAFLLIYTRNMSLSYKLLPPPLRKRVVEPTKNMEAILEKYGCNFLQRYKYTDIKRMTDSFKDTLGQGGFGCVYKGVQKDGRLVAIKVLNVSKGDQEGFMNEVITIGRTNHVNIVSLLGFCIDGNKRALVYEFMKNGSLERFIYNEKIENTITFSLGSEKLYQIALGIAKGLEYLHRGCNTRILHFDIKPHNILLDEDFLPKISDFGLAKLCPTKESVISMVGARGTMGYIAPEVYCRNIGGVSHKSDVYSYGMMVLEMIGGRKNIDATVENTSAIYFPHWIYNQLKRDIRSEDIKSEISADFFEVEITKKMIIVALWCIQTHPADRPSMSKVLDMLEGKMTELQMPPNPFLDPQSKASTSSSS